MENNNLPTHKKVSSYIKLVISSYEEFLTGMRDIMMDPNNINVDFSELKEVYKDSEMVVSDLRSALERHFKLERKIIGDEQPILQNTKVPYLKIVK